MLLDDWQRIEKIVRWTGLSVNSFALSIGLNRGENLYRIKRGDNGISKELAELIAARYPEISRAWIITGEGGMFIGNTEERNLIPVPRGVIRPFAAQSGTCDIRGTDAEQGDGTGNSGGCHAAAVGNGRECADTGLSLSRRKRQGARRPRQCQVVQADGLQEVQAGLDFLEDLLANELLFFRQFQVIEEGNHVADGQIRQFGDVQAADLDGQRFVSSRA